MNINIHNEMVNDGIDFLLSPELEQAKKLVKRAEDTKDVIKGILSRERGVNWDALEKGERVTVNGRIAFEAVEKNRFNQKEFTLLNPNLAAQFTKPVIETHLKKIA